MIRTIAISLCALAVAGCQYTVPLVDEAGLAVDSDVLGSWKGQTGSGDEIRLLILQSNTNEYVIAVPAAKSEEMVFKGTPCEHAGIPLVQCQFLGAVDGGQQRKPKYHYVTYETQEKQLTLRFLNKSVISPRISSTAALGTEIEKNKDDPRLFGDPMVFKKVY